MNNISRSPLRTVIVCLLLTFSYTACNSSKSGSVVQASTKRQESTVAPGDLGELVAGNNTFAFDLYQVLKVDEGNLLYSPFSLSEVLAMVYAGARGETAQQMAETLHFTLPQDRLHPAFNALDLRLAKLEDNAKAGFELNLANAVWVQKDDPIIPEYLDVLAANYGAGMRLVDFQSDDVAKKINRWVSEETKGRIKDIVDTVKGPLALTNAIYFYGEWFKPFEEELTQSEPFYLLDGRSVNAPLMHQQEFFDYTEGEGFQAIQLPYSNRDIAMVILLPGEGQFGELESRLTNDWVQGILQGFQLEDVILVMPKFRFETPVIGLTETLSALGMSSAFSPEADFSGIAQQELGLVISEVLHKAFIDVNEKGTEAAAASVVLATESAIGPPPIEMRIDHPFIFLIHDRSTGAILFVGRVMDPTR